MREVCVRENVCVNVCVRARRARVHVCVCGSALHVLRGHVRPIDPDVDVTVPGRWWGMMILHRRVGPEASRPSPGGPNLNALISSYSRADRFQARFAPPSEARKRSRREIPAEQTNL